MEGLAIAPDGKTLFGFVQGPLIEDGGDGGGTPPKSCRSKSLTAMKAATGDHDVTRQDSRLVGGTISAALPSDRLHSANLSGQTWLNSRSGRRWTPSLGRHATRQDP